MGKGGTARTDALPPASSPAPAAAKPHRRPAAAAAAPVHAMAGIVGKRFRKGNPEFLVRWVGFGADADTWEPMRHLMDGGLGAVKDYERLVALDKKQLLEWALEQQLKTQAAKWTASKKPKKKTAATAQAKAGRVLCEDCPRPNAAWWAPPPDGFHVPAKRLNMKEELVKERRWCRGCALTGHPQAVDIRSCFHGSCEDCMESRATHGLLDPTAPQYDCKPLKRRWCQTCSVDHQKAVAVPSNIHNVQNRCAGCGQKNGMYQESMPDEERRDPNAGRDRRRFCSGCSAKRPGTYAAPLWHLSAICEDCGDKAKAFGLADEKKQRWCSACSKAHPGAINLKHKLCESCGEKQANYGVPGDGPKKRWCAGCAKPGSVITQGATDKTKDAQRSTKRRRQSAGELEAEFEDENAASLVSLGGSETTM